MRSVSRIDTKIYTFLQKNHIIEQEVKKMAYSERELLARIVQCEAGGEGDNGMKAVASVVMNRVNVPEGEYARISQGRKY